MQSVEYLHLPFLMPVMLAAAVSSLSHCILDIPDIWKPHVNLGKPEPENRSLAFLLMLDIDCILTTVLLASFALWLISCRLPFGLLAKLMPRSLVESLIWYLMPFCLSLKAIFYHVAVFLLL